MRCFIENLGWNRSYPFNVGDLTISVDVLYNYLEVNSKVPWDDLRYLFGEIMYGGEKFKIKESEVPVMCHFGCHHRHPITGKNEIVTLCPPISGAY